MTLIYSIITFVFVGLTSSTMVFSMGAYLPFMLLEYEKIKETPKVLATIVMRKGSAPREVGTKMIILKDGKGIGTIGGGCVEADVIRKAREMLLENEPQAVLYRVELTEDEAADEGMVCGGILDVFLEVLNM